jgi:hypothetical protein
LSFRLSSWVHNLVALVRQFPVADRHCFCHLDKPPSPAGLLGRGYTTSQVGLGEASRKVSHLEHTAYLLDYKNPLDRSLVPLLPGVSNSHERRCVCLLQLDQRSAKENPIPKGVLSAIGKKCFVAREQKKVRCEWCVPVQPLPLKRFGYKFCASWASRSLLLGCNRLSPFECLT